MRTTSAEHAGRRPSSTADRLCRTGCTSSSFRQWLWCCPGLRIVIRRHRIRDGFDRHHHEGGVRPSSPACSAKSAPDATASHKGNDPAVPSSSPRRASKRMGSMPTRQRYSLRQPRLAVGPRDRIRKRFNRVGLELAPPRQLPVFLFGIRSYSDLGRSLQPWVRPGIERNRSGGSPSWGCHREQRIGTLKRRLLSDQ